MVRLGHALFREVAGDGLGDARIEVHTAEGGVASGGNDLEVIACDLHHADLETATAQVHDEHPLSREPSAMCIRERCRRGGDEDALGIEPRERGGFAKGRALAVGEVRGGTDDGAGCLAAQVRRGGMLQLAKQHGREENG